MRNTRKHLYHAFHQVRRAARDEFLGGRGPFGHGGPFGRHGRGGRMGRFFDHGDLRLVVLALLGEKPRHGYELIKAIEDRLGGAYSPSPGVIYPTLTMLEEIGQAQVETTDGNRKLYALTEAGRTELAANKPAIDALFARMDEAGSLFGGPAPQIMRAMSNLKLALKLKLGSGQLSEEQIQRMVAAIDQAAQQIERS